MNEESRDFVEQFSSMDTKLLLMRYRMGGLVPQAQVALAEVLRRRGFTDEELAAMASEAFSVESIVDAPPQEGGQAPVRRIRISHPRLRGFRIALWCMILPPLVIFLILAVPVVGNLLVVGGAQAIGCNVGEDKIHPCHLLVWDIGDLVTGYTISAFLGGGANPLLAGLAFVAFIYSPFGIVWILSVSAVFIAIEIKRRRLNKEGN